jgi:hypothetical protein
MMTTNVSKKLPSTSSNSVKNDFKRHGKSPPPAFSAKQSAGQQERLFAIVRSDPELGVRARVLRELLKQPEGLTSALRELLIEFIRAGSEGSVLMTEAEACGR